MWRVIQIPEGKGISVSYLVVRSDWSVPVGCVVGTDVDDADAAYPEPGDEYKLRMPEIMSNNVEGETFEPEPGVAEGVAGVAEVAAGS
jgi:hypothetical protein